MWRIDLSWRSMRLAVAMVVAFVALLASHAHANAPAPSLGEGELVIYRERALFGMLGNQPVLLNGVELGALSNGSYIRVKLPAGNYEAVVSLGMFMPSTRQLLTVRAGQTEYFQYDLATSVAGNLIFSFAMYLAPPRLLPQPEAVALQALAELQRIEVAPSIVVTLTGAAAQAQAAPAQVPAAASAAPPVNALTRAQTVVQTSSPAQAPATQPQAEVVASSIARAPTTEPVSPRQSAFTQAPGTSGVTVLSSGQVRIGVHRFVGPRESGFAAVQNVDAVPTNDEGRRRYQQYLSLPAPKVITISQRGAVEMWIGHDRVISQAVAHCARPFGDPCWIYAVDDVVVWQADEQIRYWLPSQVALLP